MKTKMKLKVGDAVLVTTGKDRGKTGTISQILAERNMVVVDGVNKMVKHLKTNQKDQKGQRIEYNGPISASNVLLIDPETGKPGRAAYTVTKGEGGKTVKTRIVKPSKNRKKVELKKDEPKKEAKKTEKPADAKETNKKGK